MQNEKDNSRLSTILGGVSAQDIVQYLSIEKIKNIIIIVVSVITPVIFLFTQIQMVNTQLQTLNNGKKESSVRIDCHNRAQQVFEDSADAYEMYNNIYNHCLHEAGL